MIILQTSIRLCYYCCVTSFQMDYGILFSLFYINVMLLNVNIFMFIQGPMEDHGRMRPSLLVKQFLSVM